MRALLCLLALGSIAGWSQQAQYPVPKFPPKFSRYTTEYGPRPGSPAPENGQAKTYKRVYFNPAGLRLLARSKCSTRIPNGDLINRARQSSLPDGPPVQVDWEPVGSERVAFWAVSFAEKVTVEIPLTPKDGKYVAGEARTTTDGSWQVDRLVFPKSKSVCVNEAEMELIELRRAVINILNNFTLAHFRSRTEKNG